MTAKNAHSKSNAFLEAAQRDLTNGNMSSSYVGINDYIDTTVDRTDDFYQHGQQSQAARTGTQYHTASAKNAANQLLLQQNSLYASKQLIPLAPTAQAQSYIALI